MQPAKRMVVETLSSGLKQEMIFWAVYAVMMDLLILVLKMNFGKLIVLKKKFLNTKMTLNLIHLLLTKKLLKLTRLMIHLNKIMKANLNRIRSMI